MDEEGRRRVPGVDRLLRYPAEQVHAFLQACLPHLPTERLATRTVTHHDQAPEGRRGTACKPGQGIDQDVKSLVRLQAADRDQKGVRVAGADGLPQAARLSGRSRVEPFEIDGVGNDRRSTLRHTEVLGHNPDERFVGRQDPVGRVGADSYRCLQRPVGKALERRAGRIRPPELLQPVRVEDERHGLE